MMGFTDGVSNRIGHKKTGAALDAAGIPINALETHRDYISQKGQLAFLERVAGEFPNGHMLLELAPFTHIRHYGLFFEYLTCAPTLVEAMRRLMAMMPYHTSYDRVSVLELRSGLVKVSYHSVLRNTPGCNYFVMFVMQVLVTIARSYTETAQLSHLSFDFPENGQLWAYEDQFACPVRFNQPTSSIYFRVHEGKPSLAKPIAQIVTARDVARDAYGGAPTDVLGIVEALIRADISEAQSIDHIASQTGMPERTLRRRLETEGLTCRDLLRSTRVQKAQEYLAETDLELSEVAGLVGYSDPSHFGRAFRTVTGFTPMRSRELAQS